LTLSPIYTAAPGLGSCLCHGEVLSDLVRFRLDIATMHEPEPSIAEIHYPYVVVLSQSCDLSQDFEGRKSGKPQLPEILFCSVPTAESLRATCGGSDIWKRVRQNKDERYHFLEKAPPAVDHCGEGIPELGVDFKRYFTLPTDEIYRRLEIGPTRPRTVLITPYLEHLSNRFAYFLGRVALPREHISE